MIIGNDSAAVKTAAGFFKIHQSRLSIELPLELDIFHQIGGIEPIFLHFSYIVGVDTTHLQETERTDRNIVVADLVKAIDKLRGNPFTLEQGYPVNIKVRITNGPEVPCVFG